MRTRFFKQNKMGIENGKIRIKDVAKKAGVSTGTVDRVLHNRGEVKEETRKKVIDIIREMGYTPNLIAKSLASKKLYRFAVIIPDANNYTPYWEKPLQGVLKAAEEIKDFNSIVDVHKFKGSDENSFIKANSEALKSNPDGVVFNPKHKKASLDFVKLMDEEGIPYVYLDVDLESGNNIASFGQNARQSGQAAARLISKMIPNGSEILIAKLAGKKLVSHHITLREKGFIDFFKNSNNCNCKFKSIDIDLSINTEPSLSLTKIFGEHHNIKAVFVPNSRVYRVAAFLKENNLQHTICLGYDLIQPNVEYLNLGVIDILIGQKPEDQGFNSIMALFNHLVLQKKVNKLNYSQIDIIIKENIAYYNL